MLPPDSDPALIAMAIGAVCLWLLVWSIAGTACYLVLDSTVKPCFPLRMALWGLSGPVAWALILVRGVENGILYLVKRWNRRKPDHSHS